jgi:phage terminase large subunit-like protein
MSARRKVEVAKRPATVAALTAKQAEATRYQLSGGYLHFLTYGGGRSAKTFRAVRLIVQRALFGAHSRHAIVRKAQKHVKASVWRDTLPKVMRLCFPHLKEKRDYWLNRAELIVTFANGAEIYCLGLDDESRAEAILGMEFVTVFANEISQLSYNSVVLLQSRLAQRVAIDGDREMPLMMLYDCNPPKSKKHWAYRLFVEKLDPVTGKPVPNPEDYGWFQMNPKDNPHLPDATKRMLQNMSPAERKRFWDGEFGEAQDGMWSWAHFKPLPPRDQIPDFRRIIVSVDPPAGKERAGVGEVKAAEAGIVVVGLGVDGQGYVLADRSMHGKPEQWGAAAVKAYHDFGADCVLAETNMGGDMVRAIIHGRDASVAFRSVKAWRGKVLRAEPIASLYAQGKVHHAPKLDSLEQQMLEMTADFSVTEAGYSPDRVDALVHGLTELMLSAQNTVSTMGVTGT